MKIVKLSEKAVLVRHWFRWYYVDRVGSRWQPLSPIISLGRIPKEATIGSAAQSLKSKHSPEPIISIPGLDK